MRSIPTENDPDELRLVYRETFGDGREVDRKDMLQWMEFELLNEEYQKRFGERIATMMVSVDSRLNEDIRECLRTGKSYDYYFDVPKDAIF